MVIAGRTNANFAPFFPLDGIDYLRSDDITVFVAWAKRIVGG